MWPLSLCVLCTLVILNQLGILNKFRKTLLNINCVCGNHVGSWIKYACTCGICFGICFLVFACQHFVVGLGSSLVDRFVAFVVASVVATGKSMVC